jgi:CheY-like chemotaxis protein
VARILVVEPHSDVRSLLELMLERFGHEPVRYHGTPADLESIDLAVIEPGDDVGFEAAQAVRAAGIDVVLVSIYPPEARTLALQPIVYLVKPFPRHLFERAVEEGLSRRQP